MNNIEEAYWKLLKAGLWNEENYIADFVPLSDKEWRRIIKMAQFSSALGFVTDAIEMLPRAMMPEQSTKLFLVKQKVLLMKKHEKHNLVIRHLMALMEELGVSAVLLKGQSLAQNFAKPDSRNVGDIDVYIGKENIDSLVSKLKVLGITCEEEIEDIQKHVVIIYEGIPVELHRDSLYLYTPKAKRIYQEWWDSTIFSQPRMAYIDENGKWLKERLNGAQCVLMPEKTLNLFFTFGHLLNHYLTHEFQFKQFIDLACLLKSEKNNIDTVFLSTKLKGMGMMQPWQVVCDYLHVNLGLPIDCIPFYKDCGKTTEIFGKRLIKCVFHRSNFKKEEESKPWLIRKVRAYSHYFRNSMSTFRIFPLFSAVKLYRLTIQGLSVCLKPPHDPHATHNHYLERIKNSK